ncbi:MAG: M1 family metallopeptidase, partial [Flavobacteriales bacterium]|nr:M1 family metallopeptidase [Flavobacteriales bacterium]
MLFFFLNNDKIFAQSVIPEDVRSFLDSYRSTSNPHYWKNRKPYEGYWQQDVTYYIKARLNEKTDIISGELYLTYYNNSPDKLDFVFFNLYQNAFQPGSYLHDLTVNNKIIPKYGRYESQRLGTQVEKITLNGEPLRTELDGTILKAWLPKPLLPGQSVEFYIAFKTYFDNGGSQRRRMKLFDAFGYKHYDGVHWYPRIAVYDRKFGWCTDQHLGHEFYGDFGAYYVELDFNSQFVVEATGENVNRSEVLPADLREKLDLRHFARKPWNSAPSVVIPYDSTKRKIWKFAALNVHDFAWTADPTYRIGEVYYGPWKTVALVQEPHAAGWQNAAEFAMKVIRVYSRDFGPYIYPKMVVADARDGMEYPMLTLDGGYDPDYRDLLAHEIGHNWFFGMIGNNETYRAALDEGFTQFLTAWALEHIDGPYYVQNPPRSAYVRHFYPRQKVRDGEVFMGYMADAIPRREVPINTHSDKFNGALGHGGGYRQVYYKTATLLYNLQYVLGDEIFLKALKFYFNRWYLCHPYEEDFVAAVRDYTGADIVWFWDQWFTTTKTIDYGIKSIRKIKGSDAYAITFKRKGRMEMPLEFTVTSKNGQKSTYLIPNNWYEKPLSQGVQRLPRWIGWDNIRKTYTARITVPGGIKSVQIDTSERLADVYRLNNARPIPSKFQFDHGLPVPADYKKYNTYIRPDLWYTGLDGIRLGLRMRGDYYQRYHMWELGLLVPTGLLTQRNRVFYGNPRIDLLNVWFHYQTALDNVWPGLTYHMDLRWLDGLRLAQGGFSKKKKHI